MGTLLLYGLLAIVVVVGLYFVVTLVLPAGEQIAPPIRDEAPWSLPADDRMSADDIDGVRLPVALRGYRFAETDQLLDRLAEELRVRDEQIARLRRGEAFEETERGADGTSAGDPDPVAAEAGTEATSRGD